VRTTGGTNGNAAGDTTRSATTGNMVGDRTGRAGAGTGGLGPAERLRRDRAARQVGRLCVMWCAAPVLDEASITRFAEVQRRLNELLTGEPPRELPGCSSCPVRCRALPQVAPHLAALGPVVAARATGTTSAAARARAITTAAAEVLTVREGVLYCLVVTSTAGTGADMTELLAELR
jgi:hypothetical protein